MFKCAIVHLPARSAMTVFAAHIREVRRERLIRVTRRLTKANRMANDTGRIVIHVHGRERAQSRAVRRLRPSGKFIAVATAAIARPSEAIRLIKPEEVTVRRVRIRHRLRPGKI